MALLLAPLIASTFISGVYYFYNKTDSNSNNINSSINDNLLEELKKGVKLRHIEPPKNIKVELNQFDKLVFEIKNSPKRLKKVEIDDNLKKDDWISELRSKLNIIYSKVSTECIESLD